MSVFLTPENGRKASNRKLLKIALKSKYESGSQKLGSIHSLDWGTPRHVDVMPETQGSGRECFRPG